MSLIEKLSWIPKDSLPSSVQFICPYCSQINFFYHGSTSKTRKSGHYKCCLLKFCAVCGKEVAPYDEKIFHKKAKAVKQDG